MRTVTSGFLPGDDWADEFEAMRMGGELYFRTLVEYLTYFAGQARRAGHRVRPARHELVPGPVPALAASSAWPRRPNAGEPLRMNGEVGSADGVVYFASAHAIGVRSPDALYRFMRGFAKPVIAAHHLFAAGAEPDQARQAWAAWLSRKRADVT